MSLDREEQAEYTLEITASNGASNSKALLVINVDDVNDHDPVFLRKNYQVEITENRGMVKNLLCLVARDKDRGKNAEVNYVIVSGNKTLFHINDTSGTLSSESLNFEDTRKHVLRIRATDHGDPPRSSFTTVEVLVKNVNDAPTFESEEIAVSIDEEKPAGTGVAFLPVLDEDVGKNGEFDCTYENIDPEEFGKFRVVTTSGGCEIYNKVLLKWFEGSSYSLRVRVTDRASLFHKSDVITVGVKIRDLNNHDPVFLQDSYYSSVPPGTTSILTVVATDEDNGRNARIRYSLATQSEIFQIHTRKWRKETLTVGKLTAVRGKLHAGKHIVDVFAEDQGKLKRRTKVTCFITVDSEMNRSPLTISLSKPKPTLYENVGLNTLVTTVRVKKAGVQYSIVGGNTGHAFNISRHGRVSVANMLDYETVREYRLVIRAMYKSSAGLELATEKVLRIPILDINDNEPRFTILENPLVLNINTRVHPGSVITKILAHDADSAKTLIYTIKSSSSPVPFKIDSSSGVITARTSLQSRSWSYLFTVVAEDGGTARKRNELEIHVRILVGNSSLKIPRHQLVAKVNEGPLGVSRNILSFGIKNVAEHDLTYSIIKGNYGTAFCVDVTGSLYAVRELDRESRGNYILSVSVNDGESSEISDVHITVNDIDDHRPQFPDGEILIFTDENMQEQKIKRLSAEDSDLGNITYGIVGTSRQSYSNVFAMDHGIVMITRTLDREEAATHVLTIVATDQASHKTFARAVVLVRDKNDNSPRFLSRDYAQRIPLNAAQGYFILRTLATDKDSGLNGQISYTIHPLSKMFTIDESTGWISVASELTHGSFIFNVTAEDHGTARRRDTVPVKIIIEVSAGPPRFLYRGFPRGFYESVPEYQISGTKVLKLTAVSEDIVAYALYQTNVTDFVIDPISGEITTTKPLDYENIKYYEFTIQAQDLDNDRLSFSLTQNSKSKLFSIDAAGNINTLGSLQGIKDNIYLAVTVRDNGSPVLEDTATVNVVIVNYEDSLISMSKAEVSEDAIVGKPIPVSPKITPRFKRTQYTLIYPLQSPFTLHSTLGNLSLKTRLDYEERQNYSLIVRLQETGNKKNYFDVDIRIEVKDENDNQPEFVPPGDFSSCTNPIGRKIHENAQRGSLVYQLKARDKDSGLNGEVDYSMGKCQDVDCDDLFSLDLNTGELKTTGVSLTEPQYKVNILVYDKGIRARSTRGCIIVKAGPWKPQFTKQEYHFEVDESADVGQRVGVVEAQGFGVAVTYELRSPSKKHCFNDTHS
ncbi:protocadherin Fat 3 [Paramuricea clavata]|uniref:Protocadherin Fat 3 n=1 Tax=Paramuricea clavata TaxID=317549 RepID=A0A6S7IG04_PARCT|nr:protocadherin Fat 3 [Paramuricea clavata]